MDGYLVKKLLNIKNMWAAKGKPGNLYSKHLLNLYLIKLVRSVEDGIWHTDDWEYPESESLPLPEELFPNLKWEDEPIEVSLIETFKLQSLKAIK